MTITRPEPSVAPASRRLRPRYSPALLALVVGAVVLRLPAFFATRHLVFDDGVYGASAVAMRAGGLPFRDVFSSQGPLFLPLVWVADLAGFHTLNGTRLLALAAAVLLVTATWAGARALALSPGAALLAAGVVATSGSIMWVTGPITSDGPALALATLAVALALAYRRVPSTRLALAAGVALGAALSIKSLLVPAAVPVGLILLTTTAGAVRCRHVALAVAAAGGVGLGTALPWGLARVWDQSVTYHLEAAGSRTPGANARKVISTMFDRDLPLALLAIAALLAAGTLALRRRRRSSDRHPGTGPGNGLEARITGAWLAASWLAGTVAVLLLEHPLWRSHNAHLVPAAALLVAATFDQVRAGLPPARRRAAAAAGLVVGGLVIPYHAAHLDELLWPKGPRGDEAAARGALRALPEGAWAISDEPGIVWRAGRRTPDDLVDTSILRIESNRLTAESLTRAAAHRRVCAVLVWSPRFGGFASLPARLGGEGYHLAAEYRSPRELWVRPDCRP